MRKLSVALALVAGLFCSNAKADFTAKDASAATITFKNPGVCTSVVCVPVVQLYDGTNVVTLTTAGGDAASNSLVGVPVYARNVIYNGSTWDRWTGAVTNAGTFAVQLTGATNNINNISGTISLPTGAATAANQTGGGQKTQVVDGSGNVQNAPLTAVVSSSLENNHVMKASAGQVQGCYAVNTTSVPGFLILLNATSNPADGSVTPLAVAPLAANGSAQISGALLNPQTFSTGIVAVLTSAATPFTKTTTGGLQGFLSCQVI